VSQCNVVIHLIELWPCHNAAHFGSAQSCGVALLIMQVTSPQSRRVAAAVPPCPFPGLCKACPQLGFTVACTSCSTPACCLSRDSMPYVCHFILIHLACHLKAALIITSSKVYSTRPEDCAVITKMKTRNYNQTKHEPQYLSISSS